MRLSISVFSDIEQITFRGGDSSNTYGDSYRFTLQVKIEHDRFAFIYGLAGEPTEVEMLQVLDQIKELAPTYGWKGVRWIHKGKKQEHVY